MYLYVSPETQSCCWVSQHPSSSLTAWLTPIELVLNFFSHFVAVFLLVYLRHRGLIMVAPPTSPPTALLFLLRIQQFLGQIQRLLRVSQQQTLTWTKHHFILIQISDEKCAVTSDTRVAPLWTFCLDYDFLFFFVHVTFRGSQSAEWNWTGRTALKADYILHNQTA